MSVSMMAFIHLPSLVAFCTADFSDVNCSVVF